MTKIVLAILAFLVMSHAAMAADRPGWIIHETLKPYAVMTKMLPRAVKAEGMLVVSRASASAGAKGRKIIIAGNMVVGVYRNDFAIRMLEASIDAGIEAPIRFYITEKRDGGARLAYKSPSAVFAPYMDEGGDDLKKLAEELDVIFDRIAKRALNPN